MIGETDTLFLSLGEAFISPLSGVSTDDSLEQGESGDHNSIPSHVGMYNVGMLLGCGAFGEVRLGTNKLTAEKVALKFLKKSEILSMGAAERTSTEIQCLTSLDHCNIIRLFTVCYYFCHTFCPILFHSLFYSLFYSLKFFCPLFCH